jgi:transcription termination/antitermination protein NusG
MADEQNANLQHQATGGHSLADDAVSNRSDDTALDEAQRSSGRNGLNSEQPAAPSADEESRFEAAGRPAEDVAGESATADATEAEPESGELRAEDEPTDDELAEVEQPGRVPAPPVEIAEESPEEIRMDWYILKVQSNRERSIAEALERKMRIEGLDRFFDQVIVPTEKVTEFKGGKKKVVERKLYPGYIVVHMHINDDTWFAVRETSGVGDFTGAGGKPTPMLAHEVSRIIQTEEEETAEAPKLDIKFSSGDKVKVKEGNFENFEGEVNTIDEASGRVTVMINIFGRSTPVELEYWQIEAV